MLKKLTTSYKPVNAVPQSVTRLSDLMLQLEREPSRKTQGLNSRPSTTTTHELLVCGRQSKRFVKLPQALNASGSQLGLSPSDKYQGRQPSLNRSLE